MLHQIESCYSNIQPTPIFSCNASSATHIQSPHSQTAYCSSQHHLVPSTIVSKATACNALYSSTTNPVCSSNCAAATASNFNNHPYHHPSIPHSKSLEHYHEPPKLLDHGSRHSFDQPLSYKNYDCTDGKERTNGYHHYGRANGIYHQPNCTLQTTDGVYNVSGNRYPLPATLPHTEHHYAQIVNFDRGDVPAVSTCCHQNPHYECLNNFNARN